VGPVLRDECAVGLTLKSQGKEVFAALIDDE
jgi:hypothetical protein